MEPTIFHAAYDLLPHPVFLKTPSVWLMNPAAEITGLPLATLEDLASPQKSGHILWANQTFYQVVTSQMEDDLLVMFHPDAFLANGSLAIANNLRQRLTSAFSPIIDLAEDEDLKKKGSARQALASLNRTLYQILRTVDELDICTTDSMEFCSHMKHSDLVGYAESLCKAAAPLCESMGVTLETRYDSRSASAMVDKKMLDVLFLHLISNALKHTPKGGKITLSLTRQDKTAVFTLTDPGGKLPTDVLTSPLWNQPDRMEPGRGLGLGLPLVQRIAAAHGGTVMAICTGEASRVVVTLPIRDVWDRLESPGSRFEPYAGFSPAKVILSDVLPPEQYFPDPDPDAF